MRIVLLCARLHTVIFTPQTEIIMFQTVIKSQKFDLHCSYKFFTSATQSAG